MRAARLWRGNIFGEHEEQETYAVTRLLSDASQLIALIGNQSLANTLGGTIARDGESFPAYSLIRVSRIRFFGTDS